MSRRARVRGVRLLGVVALAFVGLALSAQAALATYGRVQVVKINQGGDPSDAFAFHPTFTWTGDLASTASDFSLKGGESSQVYDVACNIERPGHVECSPRYSNVTLQVAEQPTPGYSLTDITCRSLQSGDDNNAFSAGAPGPGSPVKPASEVTADLASGTVGLKVHYNEWVVCYFTNAAAGVLPTSPPARQPAVGAASAAAPQIAVSPSRVRPGTARLIGPSACSTADVVVARVTGRSIARVTFYVDNRKVKTLRKPNRGSTWMLSLRVRGLDYGVHRVKARVEFARSSETKPRTMPISFSRCGGGAVRPQFTG
jgi:hypothetical protein